MQKLAPENFINAREFIFANGDDIYRAWFRYHFEDDNADKFMDVLAQYQHENGGFGGLSDEFEYTGPCLKCTEIAIEFIFGLNKKPSPTHPVIQKMMTYILGEYVPEIGNWGSVVVPETNDYPHCSFSRYRGNDITPIPDENERIKNYSPNEKVPFAALVAYYSEIVPLELHDEIIKYPTQHILRHWDKEHSVYDFEYLLWLVPCLKDRFLADKLTAILIQNPTAYWELDYTKSDSDYVHLPCDSGVTTPDSILYPMVKDIVDESLTYRMGQQCESGKWPMGWSYGDSEEMQRLELKADVRRTANMLVKLKRFNRIEK